MEKRKVFVEISQEELGLLDMMKCSETVSMRRTFHDEPEQAKRYVEQFGEPVYQKNEANDNLEWYKAETEIHGVSVEVVGFNWITKEEPAKTIEDVAIELSGLKVTEEFGNDVIMAFGDYEFEGVNQVIVSKKNVGEYEAYINHPDSPIIVMIIEDDTVVQAIVYEGEREIFVTDLIEIEGGTEQ